MKFQVKSVLTAMVFVLAGADLTHAALDTKDLVVREISFCAENANNPYVYVIFQTEPDFDGDAGTAGLGFWYNGDASKGLLSMFETALMTKNNVRVTFEKDPGSVINRWRQTAGSCVPTNPIKLATLQ